MSNGYWCAFGTILIHELAKDILTNFYYVLSDLEENKAM